MYRIGNYYQIVEKDYDMMKKYFAMAVADGNVDSMYNLGCYCHTEKNYDLMKQYYFMAIELNHTVAMNNLGHYYQKIEKNYDLAKQYYLPK